MCPARGQVLGRMMLAVRILRVAGVVAAASFCATGTAVGQSDAAIDGIQGEIAAYKSLEAETIAPYAEQLPLLVEEYLVALEPFVDGGEAAFRRRIEHDMLEWHPAIELTFIEAIVTREPVDVVGESLTGVVNDHIVEILRENLKTYSMTPKLDVVVRVGQMLDFVLSRQHLRTTADRLRTGRGSPALSETIHDTAARLLLDPRMDPALKLRQYETLLGMFALLQTESARDHLLLMFESFDDYGGSLGQDRDRVESLLIEAVAAFVEASSSRDEGQLLALEIFDQLTRGIVERLELDHPQLLHARLIDVLLAIQKTRVEIIEGYIEHFYTDFHAFNPAGYETVIYHLVGILVDYAVEGDFVQAPGGEAKTLAEDCPMHEKVMLVLRWYNAALDSMADRLPEIDPYFIEIEQRQVLDRIFRFFELKQGGTVSEFEKDDPRLIETMLLLVQRLADTADPDDIELYILEPFSRIAALDDDPVFSRREDYMTQRMKMSVAILTGIVRRKRRE